MTVHFLDEWISRGIWAAGGAVVSFLATFWMGLRKDRREDRTSEIAGMQAAVTMLTDLTEELRDEVSRLRERQQASEEAEETCKRNLRVVREALHAMANAMQRAGVAVPQVPGWPPAGE